MAGLQKEEMVTPKSPEPTGDGAGSFAQERRVHHAPVRPWLSLLGDIECVSDILMSL
jgi:hypothetical protein